MSGRTPFLICGAGPAGITTALMLARYGIPATDITLIDSKSLEDASRDPRSIALSWGSRQILEMVGAWPALLPHATPIHAIHVSRKGHLGRTLITNEEQQVPALGYVTRYGPLVAALSATLQHTGIQVIRPAQLAHIHSEHDHVQATLADGTTLQAGILVQAEGGLYGQQGHRTLQRDYDQVALIGHVTTSAPIPHRAYERFTSEGPLALLPQDNGYALVWCTRPVTAERLQALDDTALLAELGTMFGTRLGTFTSISGRHSFPLGLNAQPITAARVIAIANAAQTLHPVAGQGLNLGLRDAQVLADCLRRDSSPAALENFVQCRHSDRNLTIGLTDLMARTFTSNTDASVLQGVLGLGLGGLDLVPPLRRLLAGQMMYGHR